MAVKLDMGRAWNHAVALIMANLPVITVVAGVFFFLPSVATTLFVPLPEALTATPPGAELDPDDVQRIMASINEWVGSYWWTFALSTLAQTIGVLGILTLLTDRSRPTVGEALLTGAKATPTYIAAQLITATAFGTAVLLIALVGAASQLLSVVLVLMLAGALIYVGAKLSLLSPVIAVEKQANPVAALVRSWRLTKGNSLLIFAFILLLVLALMVVSAVVGLVLAAFAMISAEVGLIADAIGGGLLGAGVVVVMVAVLTAVHSQLSGGAQGQIGEKFD